MLKFFAPLLMLTLPAFAAPIAGGACDGGTYDQYVALGSTGCEAFGFIWSDFHFSGDIDGTPLSATDLSVIFKTASIIADFDAVANLSIAPGQVLTLDYGFTVAGTAYAIWSGLSTLNAAVDQTVKAGCLEGRFSGNLCSGTLLGDRYQYVPEPPSSLFAIKVHDVRTGGTDSQFQMFQGQVRTAATVPTPEPATFALMGASLLGLVALRRRRS